MGGSSSRPTENAIYTSGSARIASEVSYSSCPTFCPTPQALNGPSSPVPLNDVIDKACGDHAPFSPSHIPPTSSTPLHIHDSHAPLPSYTDTVLPNNVDKILQGDRMPDSTPPVHPSATLNQGCPDITEEVHQPSFELVYDGPYSRVYKGRRGEQQVAIKAVKYLAGDTLCATRRRMRREVSASHFNHPNILPVYGIMEPEWCEFGCIVTPWCRNRDVSSYIRHQNLKIADRYELVSGVADGLEYLHGLFIVHGDIKPGNILIDDVGRPLIGDFGLICYLDAAQGKDNTTTVHNGTTRYLAYELVKPDPPEPRSMASDIHALGCVAYELILLTRPYATRPNNATGHRRIIVDIAEGTPPAHRPISPPQSSVGALWDFLEDCWDKDPARRPSISVVRTTLKVVADQGSQPHTQSLSPPRTESSEFQNSRTDGRPRNAHASYYKSPFPLSLMGSR